MCGSALNEGPPVLFYSGQTMKNGTIIFINGTSSSGKSSIVRALQDSFTEPYLEAGIDKFIWMLPERYLDQPLWDDVLGLADRAGKVGRDLVHGMHCAILALSTSGCNVIADHVLVIPSWVKECAEMFSSMPAYLIGVQCPLEVLEQREHSRKNRTLGQAKIQFPLIHKYVTYDLEVDTSLLSPQDCALRIQSRLTEPPEAFHRIGQMI
jgi:chloramphenicol 3-O phosphotransferase